MICFLSVLFKCRNNLLFNVPVPVPHLHCLLLILIMAMQAYIAIHQPKDLCDADFARRRFIFDEFFYLQVLSVCNCFCFGSSFEFD